MTKIFHAATFVFIFSLFISMTFGAPSNARAASAMFSGEDLLKMCNSAYDTDYGMCAGYVSAISHTLLQESIAGYRACNHHMVRSQQAIDIFRGYTELYPDSLGQDAPAVVAGSLARAFPCRK